MKPLAYGALIAASTVLRTVRAQDLSTSSTVQPTYRVGQDVTPPAPSLSPYGGAAAANYNGPAFLPKGTFDLKPSLSQQTTNGKSLFGTLDQLNLPLGGLPGGGHESQRPWDEPSPSAICGSMPDTGVTRTYDFHIATQTLAPDGVVKECLTINGQFPGPMIEANWGDWLGITVTSDLSDQYGDGTSLHWHGLIQKSTPYYDGVPAVDQCPIAPGKTARYLFRADQYGSSWYHAHYSLQYTGGALGPMVIYGPRTAEYDIDLGPVMISDWYHLEQHALIESWMASEIPFSNNNLINGKMNYPCVNSTGCTPAAGVSKFRFQSGRKHRLRLVNAGGEGTLKFSIDDHNMTIIANDFVPIHPYTTNVVTLAVGQRTDVIVEATGNAGDSVWMRSLLTTAPCSLYDGISPNGLAAIYYEDADTESEPQTETSVTDAQLSSCANDDLSLTVPFCPVPLDPNPSTTETLVITHPWNGTQTLWAFNNVSFRGDYNSPILLNTKVDYMQFEPQWNVYNFGSNKSVRVIVENRNTYTPHPMHLHGHKFNVLAEGFGEWDGTIVNPEETMLRDTHLLHIAKDESTPAYMVMQWNQDNPGVWPLHCHIALHLSQGLYIAVVEQPDEVQKMDFPPQSKQTCQEWWEWTGANIPDQIDSGL